MVFTSENVQPRETPWGEEVKRKLRERGMSQNKLSIELRKRGFLLEDRGTVNGLIFGNGTKTRAGVIAEINKILGIDFQST